MAAIELLEKLGINPDYTVNDLSDAEKEIIAK